LGDTRAFLSETMYACWAYDPAGDAFFYVNGAGRLFRYAR